MTRKKRLLEARSYALYYGQRKEQELSEFEIAIVEPQGQTPYSLRKMQDAGTLVLAYLSVMEINSDSMEASLLQEDDFLTGTKGTLKNEQYGNLLVDLRSKRWLRILRHKADSLLCAGYDGLFMDTIADVENVSVSADCRTELILAAASFIADLRNDYNEHILVQNNGVERLCLMTARLIDAICWESPPFGKTECAAWSKEVVRRLKWLYDKEKVAVFLLVQIDNEDKGMRSRWMARETANENGFLLYEAPRDYVAGVNTMANIKRNFT